MKVVRRGVFETNSSSSHSLTICGDGNLSDTCLPVVNGVVEIYPGEFGWGVEEHWDAASKASYALTYLKGGGGCTPNAAEELRELDMLRRVISNRMDGREVRFVPARDGDDYYAWGYIDHQSAKGEGNIGGEAFASEEALAAFIFNPASGVRIDNDNISDWRHIDGRDQEAMWK